MSIMVCKQKVLTYWKYTPCYLIEKNIFCSPFLICTNNNSVSNSSCDLPYKHVWPVAPFEWWVPMISMVVCRIELKAIYIYICMNQSKIKWLILITCFINWNGRPYPFTLPLVETTSYWFLGWSSILSWKSGNVSQPSHCRHGHHRKVRMFNFTPSIAGYMWTFRSIQLLLMPMTGLTVSPYNHHGIA